METIDFNKHDINIFINDIWQIYVVNIGTGDPLKLQGNLNFTSDQQEGEFNPQKATFLPETSSNTGPAEKHLKIYLN